MSGNRIVLGGNIVATVPTVNGTLTDTLSLPIMLNGTRTVTANQSGSGSTLKAHHLVISGVIGETGGSFGLTKTGGITGVDRNVTFRGSGHFMVNGKLDLGSGVVTRTDPGTVYLAYPENAFSGQLQVSHGVISIASIADSGTASPIGTGSTIQLGQNGWNTTGKLQFTGAGTWILSGANTYTGATVVTAGTLLINGSTHADSAVSVGAAGTLGGSGTVNGAVALTAGGTLAPGSGGVGTLTLTDTGAAALTLNGNRLACDLSGTAEVCDRVDVAGTLVLNGVTTISLSCPPTGAPPGVYTVMTYAAKTGSGNFVLDRTYPNTALGMDDTHVYLTVNGAGAFDSLVWAGDGAANVWDTATANWSAGVYSDNTRVVFDDTGSDSPAVTIAPAAVAPYAVVVDTATKSYTIGGTPANFNNSVALANGVTVSGETLTSDSATGRARLVYSAGSGSAMWDGDIVLSSGGANYLSCDSSGGTLFVGASAEDTVSGANRSISVRGSGTTVINSTLQIGSGGITRDDPGTCLLNAAAHQFGNSTINQGTLRLGADNVMPHTIVVTIGKSGNTADATLDLNGYD